MDVATGTDRRADAGGRRGWRRRTGRRRWGIVVLVGVLALSLTAAHEPGHDVVTYSRTVTLPVPPASGFQGQSGGDGWDVSLDATRVYNVFHHLTDVTVSCLEQADGSPCAPSFPKTVRDAAGACRVGTGLGCFTTVQWSDTELDLDTGRLYTFGIRQVAPFETGVVCIDTRAPDADPNPFCGFTPLALGGDGTLAHSGPSRVGDRWYSLLHVGADAGKVMCFDLAAGTACPGQPYPVGFTVGDRAAASSPIGQLVFFQDQNELGCFDTTSLAACVGAWPVPTQAFLGGPFPMLSSSGTPIGVCMPAGQRKCFDLAGVEVAAPPPGLTASVPSSLLFDGGPIVLGTRVYVPAGHPVNGSNTVGCYDFAVSAACPGFPLNVDANNQKFLYSISTDPFRPACIWINRDSGTPQIQNFDAYSGGPCGDTIRVLMTQFIESEQCAPTAYESLELVSPEPATYTGATLAVQDNGGGSSGIADQAFAGGVVDLTGLGIESLAWAPQFVVTLTDPPADIGEVTLRLVWTGEEDPACGDGEPPSNTDPTVAADQGAVSTPEGTDPTNTGTYGDDDGDPVTLAADVGAVVDEGGGTWSWSNPAPDGPDGPYTVTITADDGAGGVATTTFEVTVLNVAPTVEAGDDVETTFGAIVTLAGSFDDPGTDADWIVHVDWGEGSTTSYAATATGAVMPAHHYVATGVHSVEVCVTDKDGAVGCDTLTVTVTSTDGKVTGGDPTVRGAGRGGFVVQGGRNGIKGSLQFRDDTTWFHAHEMTALAVSEDRTSAWFGGVSKDGRTFVAYVEDNGEPNVADVYQLWIDGVLHGGDGSMQHGNIQIHRR